MLEKNKDYVEFTLQYTSVERTRDKDYRQVCFNGYSDYDFPGVPMDVVCKEFDHKVVVVGKRDFERLQAAVDINAAIAKEWEKNYDLLLKKTGFDTTKELVFYLTNVVQCDTLQDAIATLQDKVQRVHNGLISLPLDDWKDMKKKLEECEKDYISERDKAEALEKENKELKNKLNEFDPIPEFKELTEKLQSTEDVEELEWVLNHTCGGWGSVNGWRPIARFWKQKYETLSKLVGFSSVEEIQDYLTNEAECDTLHEAIASLEYSVKFARDERMDLSKKLDECEKDYISERDKAEALEKEIGIYGRTLNEWKEGTGCPSPSAAKTLIELIGQTRLWRVK